MINLPGPTLGISLWVGVPMGGVAQAEGERLIEKDDDEE